MAVNQHFLPTTSAVSSADEKAGEEDKEVGEEEPLIQMVECQIWQDDDRVKPWSSPCTYSGRLLRIQCQEEMILQTIARGTILSNHICGSRRRIPPANLWPRQTLLGHCLFSVAPPPPACSHLQPDPLLPTSLFDLYSQHISTNRRCSSSMERSTTKVHLSRPSPVLAQTRSIALEQQRRHTPSLCSIVTKPSLERTASQTSSALKVTLSSYPANSHLLSCCLLSSIFVTSRERRRNPRHPLPLPLHPLLPAVSSLAIYTIVAIILSAPSPAAAAFYSPTPATGHPLAIAASDTTLSFLLLNRSRP
ncbi:hypothetical protein BHE74_00025769 [Ensete ventricosum]|nr:hypothetical protein BHE74_00025769 [Ensete ventricosum]